MGGLRPTSGDALTRLEVSIPVSQTARNKAPVIEPDDRFPGGSAHSRVGAEKMMNSVPQSTSVVGPYGWTFLVIFIHLIALSL
jgi:hypothetical protein